MRPLPAALKEIAGVVSASRLERPPVPTVPFGIKEVDALTGGLPRGALTEIYGAASTGRTGLMMAALAAATARQELCVLIDASDSFDPQSAEAAGVELRRLLWVRCGNENRCASLHAGPDSRTRANCDLAPVQHTLETKQRSGSIMPPAKVWYGRSPARSERQNAGHGLTRIDTDQLDERRSKPTLESVSVSPCLRGERNSGRAVDKRRWARPVEQALKVADLVLQSGGFGLIVIDFADIPADITRRIPLTSWFRFRRAVENTPAVLLAIAQESCAKTCASLVLRMGQREMGQQGSGSIGSVGTATGEPLTIRRAQLSHARVFPGLNTTIEVIRSRIDAPAETLAGKKPPRSTRSEFNSRTEWGSAFAICDL